MRKHMGRRLAALVVPVIGAVTLPAAAVGEHLEAAEAARGADPLATLGLVILATALSIAGAAFGRQKEK